MKTKKLLLNTLMLSALLLVASCGEKTKDTATENSTEEEAEPKTAVTTSTGDNSKNALDWQGVYQGIVPCADCEGIKTKITLSKNGEFSRSQEYLGKSERPMTDSGTFTWNTEGSKISLSSADGSSQSYQVGENVLFHLDKEGNRITGDLAENYKLMKNASDSNLENKTWILVELMGETIEQTDNNKIIKLTFNSEKGTLSGHNGCNVFTGGYELLNGNRYKAGPFANTLMACKDMKRATKFMGVIESGNNYTVVDGMLNINKGRMATMAKFKTE